MERETAVIVLQAHVRGLLVRRRVWRVLREYEAVVRDIEGGHAAVRWGKGLLSTPHIYPQAHYHEAAAACRVDGQHGGRLFSNNTEAAVTCSDERRSVQVSENELCMPATDAVNRTYPLSQTDDIQCQHRLSNTNEKCDQTLLDSVLPEKKVLLSEANPSATEGLVLAISDPGEAETSAMTVTNNPHIEPERESHLLELSDPEKEYIPKCVLTGHPDQRFDSLEWTGSSSVWSDDTLDTDLSSNNLNELQNLRSHLAMEILWVQQAIASRKNYLMVRKHLENQD